VKNFALALFGAALLWPLFALLSWGVLALGFWKASIALTLLVGFMPAPRWLVELNEGHEEG